MCYKRPNLFLGIFPEDLNRFEPWIYGSKHSVLQNALQCLYHDTWRGDNFIETLHQPALQCAAKKGSVHLGSCLKGKWIYVE